MDAEDKLTANRRERSLAVGAEAPSLLAGLIVDSDGNRMTPTHATKKVKRYCYYVSAPLIAVLASAVTYGLWASLFACLVSVLAYNFFFLPPLYTFTIADPENVVTLFFFTVVALIASNLAARVRAQAVAARERRASPRNSTFSAASSQAPRRSMICSGPPRIKSP